MTRSEKRAIEIWASDLSSRVGFGKVPSVSLSKKKSRLEIHTDYMGKDGSEEFAKLLRRKLDVSGWRVEVSVEYPGGVFVKYKEKYDKGDIPKEALG